ncbi:hypothetical protein HYALB_00001329 [Hymenoscyphus albidus]|uniref:Uncharacterized protein n=1 Tax=Hymenoscyphus albidus TaxID=595503 RepID=A0A9N9LF33_9HELO|nr:hypothetical protein HYALB_00001329 [Hymenoscyphus albidus]
MVNEGLLRGEGEVGVGMLMLLAGGEEQSQGDGQGKPSLEVQAPNTPLQHISKPLESLALFSPNSLIQKRIWSGRAKLVRGH